MTFNSAPDDENEEDIVDAEVVGSGFESPTFKQEGAYDSPEGPLVTKERLRASGYFSWLVVIALTAMMVALTSISQFGEQEPHETTISDLMQINLQAKVLVGQKVFAESAVAPAEPAEPTEQAGSDVPGEDASQERGQEQEGTDSSESTTKIPVPEALDDGTYEQRLCYAIILNEIYGPQKSKDYLGALVEKVRDAEFEPSDEQSALRETVESLVNAYDGGDYSQSSVSEDAKTQLKEKLGFCGELLLAPDGGPNALERQQLVTEASSSAFALLGGLGLAVLMFFSGVVAGCVILSLLMSSKSPIKFQPNFDATNIYIQTFAIWMVIFFGVQFGISAMDVITNQTVAIFVNVAVFFLSLVALLWPVMMGRSIGQVLRDIGWTGQSFFKNIAIGFATYMAWLPMVVIAFFMVFVMMALMPTTQEVGEFELPPTPSHPVQQLLAQGDAMMWLGVVLAACVAAPIVEETMFRGVLYRHLRELHADKNRFLSVVVSSVLNGLIFAAIHPQGVMAIPLLTMLAVGFSFTREWRNSLVSSITMHAINNGLVTGFMFLLL